MTSHPGRDDLEQEGAGPDDTDMVIDGMLLPPLCAQADYVSYAKEAGLSVSGGPKDISEDVKATW